MNPATPGDAHRHPAPGPHLALSGLIRQLRAASGRAWLRGSRPSSR